MQSLIVALSLLACSSADIAERPDPQRTDVDVAIERGLAFLAKDAVAWREEHHCVSCHHAGLVVWAMRESKQRGHAVDEPLLAELTKWMAESGDGTTGVPRPAAVPRAFNEKAVSFLLALASNPEPDEVSRQGMERMLNTVKKDQLEEGYWAAWPETRPPIFGDSNERATIQATLALLPAVAAGDVAAKAARDKALTWLTTTATDDDPQSVALRVVLWRRLGRSSEEIAPLVARISERQNGDGGWSQTKELQSDGWATGQTLYALAHAGAKSDDPRVVRGQQFLVKTQREDGSWAMTSRPTKPGGAGATSAVPITGAGSAWAVIGLARSR